MKKTGIFIQFLFLLVLVVLLSITGCEKNDDAPGHEEAYIIGYDQCAVIYDTTENKFVGARGYIVSLSEREDTVLCYNIPDTLYDFPPEYFDHYIFDCFFPRSEWKTYKMMIDYEYVDEDEKYEPIICFDQYTYRLWNVTDERTEIKILHVTR